MLTEAVYRQVVQVLQPHLIHNAHAVPASSNTMYHWFFKEFLPKVVWLLALGPRVYGLVDWKPEPLSIPVLKQFVLKTQLYWGSTGIAL